MIALALALLVQDSFASAVLLPDVDGDSHADLVVLNSFGYGPSRLWLVSGAELKVLVEFKTGVEGRAPTLYGIHGSSHDFNEDGLPDLMSYWYVPGEDTGSFETRILDAKDPRRVLLTWEGTARALGPDRDDDGLPDPTFVERLAPGRFAVSQRGSGGELLWQWPFASKYSDIALTWIEDVSGDDVRDLVVLHVASRDGLPAHVLNGATGSPLVESQLVSVSGLWVTVAACSSDWSDDGAGDFFVGLIDPYAERRFENRLLLVSGADLSILRTWKHSDVFPSKRVLFDPAMGYVLAVIKDASGSETCLAGEPAYEIDRGCVVALTRDSVQIVESKQPDSRSFGGYINPGTDWNGDGSDDYIAGCGNPGNWVPDHGFLEIRDGRTHSLLLTLRLADLDPKAGAESGEEDD